GETQPDTQEAKRTATQEEASLRQNTPAKIALTEVAAEGTAPSILVTPEQRRPTGAEAYEKILELNSPAESVLRTAEAFRGKPPIVILDELQVERVETKRDKGWVHLQMESHVRIADDGVEFKRRHEKARWELRRDESGWVVIAPPDRSYVTRDVAVRE